MTNLTVLPITPDASATQRLAGELAAALNSGADLGSRVPHIHKQVQLLHYLGQTLRAKTVEMAATSDCDGPEGRELLDLAEEIVQLVDRMTAAARQMLS